MTGSETVSPVRKQRVDGNLWCDLQSGAAHVRAGLFLPVGFKKQNPKHRRNVRLRSPPIFGIFSTFATRIRRLVRRVRITYAYRRTVRTFSRKYPHLRFGSHPPISQHHNTSARLPDTSVDRSPSQRARQNFGSSFFFGEPEAFGKSTIRFGRIPSVWVSHGCMASSTPILPRNLKDLFRVAPEKLGPPTCPILARDGRDKAVGRVFAPESAVDAEDDARRRKTDRQSVLHCGR